MFFTFFDRYFGCLGFWIENFVLVELGLVILVKFGIFLVIVTENF